MSVQEAVALVQRAPLGEEVKAEVIAKIRRRGGKRRPLFDEGCDLICRLRNRIIESDWKSERERYMRALDRLSWYVAHVYDREPVNECFQEDLAAAVEYARGTLGNRPA